MATLVQSSDRKVLEDSFKDNVVALREHISKAPWANETLMDSTQHHFSEHQDSLALNLANDV